MTLLDLTGVVEQSSDAANNVKGGTPGQRAGCGLGAAERGDDSDQILDPSS
jgi:hypothetical protein